jgi:hypothetical protein
VEIEGGNCNRTSVFLEVFPPPLVSSFYGRFVHFPFWDESRERKYVENISESKINDGRVENVVETVTEIFSVGQSENAYY